MVPSSVLALLLLFPTTDASAAASKTGKHSPRVAFPINPKEVPRNDW